MLLSAAYARAEMAFNNAAAEIAAPDVFKKVSPGGGGQRGLVLAAHVKLLLFGGIERRETAGGTTFDPIAIPTESQYGRFFWLVGRTANKFAGYWVSKK